MYCRAITNMMQKYNFIDGVQCINSHFSDSGLFGISVEGPGSHSQELLHSAIDELNRLKESIKDDELTRAKSILKMNILIAMERQEDRLEEIARNYMAFGDLNFH
jgi:predicted Zn-dependent peptidase